MSENLIIGISDWKVCKSPGVLVTYALGSCVGTCIIDRASGIAGLSHIMLPDSTQSSGGQINRMKFADTALSDMVDKMIAMGAQKARLQAKIAGGALMFATKNDSFNIGERNVAAVRAKLSAMRIPIVASATGENYGRTVLFYSENGVLEIKSAVKGIEKI